MSSGLRINTASDDAAGLAIADSLRADKKVFQQGIRNFNDGLSLINIADEAVGNLTNIVTRLKELAEQAANGTYSTTQRTAIDAEAQALSDEYFRIAKTTTFNGINLLDGSLSTLRLQGGYGQNGCFSPNLGGAIGTGTYSSTINFMDDTFSDAATDLAFGDINGDGLIDMVSGGITDASTGYIAIRLGTGSGSFGTATTLASETRATGNVKLVDINGDGVLDLTSAGSNVGTDGYVNVRLGTGSGSFGTATSYANESRATTDLEYGDVNGDGFLDMVTTGHTDGYQVHVTIRLGDGAGTFGASSTYLQTGNSPTGLVLADFNNDGLLDIASAATLFVGNDGYTTVRLGTGGGTFGEATSYLMEGDGNRWLDSGDLNGDGYLDLVASGVGGADGVVVVRLGSASGTFGASTSYVGEGGATRRVALGDVNGDGKLDMVTAGYEDGGSGIVSIRLGNGDGTFGTRTSYADIGGTFNSALGLVDLSRDGVLDIVNATRLTGPNAGYAVRIGDTKSGTAPLLDFSLKTAGEASQALIAFSDKLTQLTLQRGTIGAFQSRVEVGISNLQSAADNFAAAESRIRDADIAEETSKMLRLQILQSAGVAVLAQGNLQPQIALKLLESK